MNVECKIILMKSTLESFGLSIGFRCAKVELDAWVKSSFK